MPRPAAAYAHSADRNWEIDGAVPEEHRGTCADIARQLVEFPYGDGVDVVLGGGRAMFLPAGTADPEDEDRSGYSPGRPRSRAGMARRRREPSFRIRPGRLRGIAGGGAGAGFVRGVAYGVRGGSRRRRRRRALAGRDDALRHRRPGRRRGVLPRRGSGAHRPCPPCHQRPPGPAGHRGVGRRGGRGDRHDERGRHAAGGYRRSQPHVDHRRLFAARQSHPRLRRRARRRGRHRRRRPALYHARLRQWPGCRTARRRRRAAAHPLELPATRHASDGGGNPRRRGCAGLCARRWRRRRARGHGPARAARRDARRAVCRVYCRAATD